MVVHGERDEVEVAVARRLFAVVRYYVLPVMSST